MTPTAPKPRPTTPRLRTVHGRWLDIDILPGVPAKVCRDASGKHRLGFDFLLDQSGSDLDPDNTAEIAAQLECWRKTVTRCTPDHGVRQRVPQPEIVLSANGDALLDHTAIVAVGCSYANAGAFGFCPGFVDVGQRLLAFATELARLDAMEFESPTTRRATSAA